ncbi:MAG: hypothetical protein ABIT08_07680 [Bacteroidia bacterium]
MRKLRGVFIYISLNPAVEIIIGCEDTADGGNFNILRTSQISAESSRRGERLCCDIVEIIIGCEDTADGEKKVI